jgi:ATP-dependent exoDNAse (exonuclease V) beta subunit
MSDDRSPLGPAQDDLFVHAADPSAPLRDDEARRRIREDLDETFFVEAAAGTGKTTALVDRIVALLRAGKAALRRVVALTYTDKAAGEMKLRLRQAIEEARKVAGDPREREMLEEATRQLELAAIGTIHSFCGDLLREWPVEAEVDPAFEVLPDGPASLVLDRAFDGWFEEALSEPPEGVRRILRWRKGKGDDPSARQQLRDAAAKLVEHRDFPAAWTRPDWEREPELDAAVLEARKLAGLASYADQPDKAPAVGLRNLAQWIEDLDQLELDAPRDHDWIEAEIRRLLGLRGYDGDHLWTWKGGGKTYGTGPDGPIPKAHVIERRDALRTRFETLVERAEADLAACLREDLRPVVDRYERLKAEEGALDFIDMLLRARDLIRDRDEVRAALQARFTHFFVDEFQDTDPLQAEILLLLASDDPAVTDFRRATPVGGKLFAVGDPKQAIYRFRRADVQLYEEVKRLLRERGVELLHLTTSFRSVPSIQSAVNAAFSRVMEEREDGSQAAYVPLERSRLEPEAQPGVVALPVPRPYGKGRYNRPAPITKTAIAESYPDAVGAYIQWLTEESGWEVEERGREEHVPIRSRHICILLRRIRSMFGDPPRAYVEALERRGISHVLVGGRSFYEREEILALRAILTAIEWPDDALHVYAALKGPFFALSDSQLLAYRGERGTLHPLRPRDPVPAERETGPDDPDRTSEDGETTPENPELAEVEEALALLAELHDRRNERPVAETLNRLLAAVRAHAGIANWMNGEQALANCHRLVDRAREFEAGGAPSFRAFVDWLDDQAERGGGEEGPIVEEGTEGVRMMSVHRAKGLEFPVVILGDGAAVRVRARGPPGCLRRREAPRGGGVGAARLRGRDPRARPPRDPRDRRRAHGRGRERVARPHHAGRLSAPREPPRLVRRCRVSRLRHRHRLFETRKCLVPAGSGRAPRSHHLGSRERHRVVGSRLPGPRP